MDLINWLENQRDFAKKQLQQFEDRKMTVGIAMPNGQTQDGTQSHINMLTTSIHEIELAIAAAKRLQEKKDHGG